MKFLLSSFLKNSSVQKSFLFLSLSLLLAITSIGQHRNIDSLKSELQSTHHDTVRIKTILSIALNYRRVNFDSLLLYGEQALILSTKVGDHLSEAQANLCLGEGYWRHGELDIGLPYCERALLLAEVYDFQMVQAASLNNLGLIYNYQGNYPLALEHYQNGLEIAEKLEDKSTIANILINIGGIYYNLSEYESALEYWKRTLDIYIELGNDDAAGSAMNNIGLAYFDKGDLESALKYYYRSLNLYEEEAFCPKIYPLENIGHIYLELENQDSAKYYLDKALNGAEKCQDPFIQLGALTGLAEISRKENNPSEALVYLEKAVAIGRSTGLKRELRTTVLSLSELYEEMDNPVRALRYFKMYSALGDSLFNDETTKEIGRLEAKYEFEKQQREREVELRFKEFESERELNRQKWLRNSFIGGFIIMIIIALLIYRNVKRKITANRKLRVLNQEINKQQDELKGQAEELNLLNSSLRELNDNLEEKIAERTNELEEKNTELANKNIKLADYAFINAHRLRAPVATIMGLIDLFNNENIDFAEKEEIVNKIKLSTTDLDEVVKQIRIILEEEGLGDS